MIKQQIKDDQKGFTIVELMIATAVLSVLLVTVTIIMINIGNLYYKGINQSRVQTATRSVSDELSQGLQLRSSTTPFASTGNISVSINGFTGTIQAYCLGGTRYSYIKGIQIGTTSTTANPQIKHVLWRDDVPPAGCTPADLRNISTPGAELIPPKSRITSLDISGSSPYKLTVGVAYGDNDLLRNPTAPSAKCIGKIADQFCATSVLESTVVQRL